MILSMFALVALAAWVWLARAGRDCPAGCACPDCPWRDDGQAPGEVGP